MGAALFPDLLLPLPTLTSQLARSSPVPAPHLACPAQPIYFLLAHLLHFLSTSAPANPARSPLATCGQPQRWPGTSPKCAQGRQETQEAQSHRSHGKGNTCSKVGQVLLRRPKGVTYQTRVHTAVSRAAGNWPESKGKGTADRPEGEGASKGTADRPEVEGAARGQLIGLRERCVGSGARQIGGQPQGRKHRQQSRHQLIGPSPSAYSHSAAWPLLLQPCHPRRSPTSDQSPPLPCLLPRSRPLPPAPDLQLVRATGPCP